MKITIEINNNEDVTEAIKTLEKLLVETQTKTTKKVVKKATPKAEAPVEAPAELVASDVFALAKELAKEHGSAAVKGVIKKYGEKMADIKPEDLANFNKDLQEMS